MRRTRRTRRSPVAIVIAILSIGMLATTPITAAPAPTPVSRPPTASAALFNGQVQLQAITGGFASPVGIANAGDGSGRLFIVEQGGTVRTVIGGGIQPGFFLDVRSVAGGLSLGSERGLLGLAFHPSYESNRKVFAYYTNGGGDLVISQFTANPDGLSAPVGTADPLLIIEHSSQGNHNGGHLMFGPDGLLYAFTGDGGGGGDPGENAQNVNSLLGKALRIAPDLNGGYSNPAGNPYIGVAGADEIWAIGLRNPWKASFDRGTNGMWIADVGQDAWEEVNSDPANAAGRNWGWDCREGSHPFESTGCSGLSFADPVAEYANGSGPNSNCSVTGGYVYRGAVFQAFVGEYVLGDFCSGRIWTFNSNVGLPPPPLQLHQDTGALISSFGEAENGEIYMTDINGILYRVVAPPFVDVASSVFIDDITWLFYQGITTGCGGGSFCPKATVSREEMASFIARARGLTPQGTDWFTDDETSIHEPAINAIRDEGITLGCGPNLFCPKSLVTREQMASFLIRALGLKGVGTDYFTDDNGSVHEGDINTLRAEEITLGCAPGLFCPTRLVTREEMAAFLHRAFD
jgi:glucose/arabinose dehydrogenase